MSASQTVSENIDQVVRQEEGLTERRGVSERVGEAVGSVASTLPFVGAQVALVAGWCLANAGLVPGVPVFDPFPYSLLGTLMSLQAVLLACCVLMKQAHESRVSERRSHLNLQITLLIEKEVTKLIQATSRTNPAEGGQQVVDAEMRELGETTKVEHFSKELDRRLDGSD